MKVKLLPHSLKLFLFTAIIITYQSTSTKAAGFYNYAYTDVGRAFAGDVAGGYDASTVYANPAGMRFLTCREVKGGIDFIFPQINFKDGGSSLPTGISNIAGSNPRDKTIFVPNIYAVYPFEKLTIGVGFTSPYGIDLDYDEGWVGRFHRLSSRIETYDIFPTVAFDVTDWLSLGIGLDIQSAHIDMTKAKTVSSNLTTALFGLTVPQLTAAGFNIPEFHTQFKDDNWAVGVNVGAVAALSRNFKLGFDFLSGTSHTLKSDFITIVDVPSGTAAIDQQAALIAAANSVPAQADLDLPNILTLGASWDIDPCWNVGTQIQWFNWSRFDGIQVTSQTGGVLLDALPEQFKDTISVAVGTEYQALENLAIQFGFMYDQSPTQDSTRSPAIPGGDRYWLTAGATLIYKPGFSATAGYAHIFTSDTSINLIENAAIAANAAGTGIMGTNNSTITGSFSNPIDILSISLRLVF